MIKRNFRIIQTIFLLVLLSLAIFAAGEVDLSFDARTYRGENGSVSKIVRQPDGKIIAVGNFLTVNGIEKNSILRLNSDFTIDNTFVSPQFSGYSNIAIQADGKLIVVGSFKDPVGGSSGGIRRLNPDGSIDTTFVANAEAPSSSSGLAISYVEIQPDGKILISGSYCLVNQNSCYVSRLNPDGTVDSSFTYVPNSNSRILKLQPDGKILVNNGFNQLVRLNSDGSPDTTFQNVSVSRVYAVEIDSAGKIYIGGDFTTVNGFTTGNITRLNSDGSLDTSYTPTNANFGVVNQIKIDSNGKIIVAGLFSQFNGSQKYSVVRLNSDGTIDNPFSSPFPSARNILSVLPLPDGKVLLGGSANPALYLLNSDGSTNNSLNVLLGNIGFTYRILPQPDGKILAGGEFIYVNGNVERRGLARFNADGSLDAAFQPSNMGTVSDLALQPDGKILVSRNIFPNLVRLNADGTVDAGFTNASAGIRNKVLPSGKILTCGSFQSGSGGQNVLIRRLNADGTLDATFNSFSAANQSSDVIYDCEIQTDGKIVIGGRFDQISGLTRGNFARLNADGTVDTSFAPPFGATGAIREVEIQSTGKIILGGPFSGINGNTNYKAIARVNTDASLDTSFTPLMITVPLSVDPVIYSITIKVQPNDKILVTDNTYGATLELTTTKLLRLFPNGQLDSSLITNTNARIADIELQNDGKILISGNFSRVNGVQKTAIARLLNTPNRIKYDYDGDGKADVSVFRPSNGVWYLNQSNNGFTGVMFGQNGDLITPADFDGDGKADIAVFRPSNGAWYRLNSSDGSFSGVVFGQNGDIPIPGDFDGDGKADVNVFRPSNGAWYRLNSSDGSFTGLLFGQNGDIPLQADFDGDGKNDIAVFRPSNGTFYWLESSTGNFKGIPFGVSTDIPTMGDFDGDNKTDIAVFRPSNGAWYRYNSSNGAFVGVIFGQNGDVPVAADYDGDGKADIAVFRNGVWYYLQSSNGGFVGFNFGYNTDKPTPAAF